MADPQHRQQQQQMIQRPTDAITSILPEKGPSSSQVLAVAILLPIGASLLFLAGITLTGTLIGLGISTPLFIIFSPILVPAALVIALAVTGFLLSGAFGTTALSSLSWMANNLRRLRVPALLDQAKGRVQDTAGQVGQKTKEAGQAIQTKAQEGVRSGEGGEAHKGGRAHDVTIEEEDGKAQEGKKT